MFTANSPTAELQTLYVYVQFHHRGPARWLGHQEEPSAEEPARRYGTGSPGGCKDISQSQSPRLEQ